MCSTVCEVPRKNSNWCIGLTGGHGCSSNVEACVEQVSDLKASWYASPVALDMASRVRSVQIVSRESTTKPQLYSGGILILKR